MIKKKKINLRGVYNKKNEWKRILPNIKIRSEAIYIYVLL